MRNATAIILAGGDGTRLLSVTQAIGGDDRPKQFCRLLGPETLLDRTRRRTAGLITPGRTFFSVTGRHEPYYRAALSGVPQANIVVQPDNRGTAPAILYTLLRLAATPTTATTILPSDHYISDDAAFMARVEAAMEVVVARPDLVVLLGIESDRPETDYGRIEPGERLPVAAAWPVYRVKRFWEKPTAEVAEHLAARGCYWNSFVVVANPARLRRVIAGAVPALAGAFAPLAGRIGTPWESAAAQGAYARISTIDFSRDVLQADPETLAVLPVGGLEWNDLGTPARLLSTRASIEERLATALSA